VHPVVGKAGESRPGGHRGQAHIAHFYYSSYVQCLGPLATILRTDRWQDYDRRRRYQVVRYGHRTGDDGLRQPRGCLVPRNDSLQPHRMSRISIIVTGPTYQAELTRGITARSDRS
jgi:hypothetical protein